MRRTRKKSPSNNILLKQKRIIRCRSKMIPVFEDGNCDDFIKKEGKEPNQSCKNCEHSF